MSYRYMQRAKLADLFIDTPLVNAHTSATDVLWAGVPMVTLPGHAMISRVAASILIADGLQHFIARNLDVTLPSLPLLPLLPLTIDFFRIFASSMHPHAPPSSQDYIGMAAAFKRDEAAAGRVAARARRATESARKSSDLFDTQVLRSSCSLFVPRVRWGCCVT